MLWVKIAQDRVLGSRLVPCKSLRSCLPLCGCAHRRFLSGWRAAAPKGPQLASFEVTPGDASLIKLANTCGVESLRGAATSNIEWNHVLQAVPRCAARFRCPPRLAAQRERGTHHKGMPAPKGAAGKQLFESEGAFGSRLEGTGRPQARRRHSAEPPAMPPGHGTALSICRCRFRSFTVSPCACTIETAARC